MLHVGIHKTASTYIQHRLKGNQSFLRRNGLLYPKRRQDHLALVKALREGDPRPWDKLLHQATGQGCRPLVSAEILSLDLTRPSRTAERGTLLSDLLGLLDRRGVQLEIVAFLRDQPAYLNSRYTQLIKRFYFTVSFERYLTRTMLQGGESSCDFHDLFDEALSSPQVRCTFLPFRSGEADPCERLLQAVGVETCAGLNALDQRANAQPGWQAVWIAQRLARRMRKHHPQAWRSSACKIRIRKGLERTALEHHWQAEPFQGINEQLLCRLEERYGASNDRFAQRVWGCAWRDLFPRPILQPSPSAPRNRLERRQLIALGESLLAEGLSACG